MYRTLTACIVVALLVLAVAASASVTLSSPKDGATVGPSTDVVGQVSARAFCIVTTSCTAADGTDLGMVPGLRHWTNDDNSIQVRISTPRVSFGDKGQPVNYAIHVRAYSTPEKAQAAGDPDLGEATVNVKSAG